MPHWAECNRTGGLVQIDLNGTEYEVRGAGEALSLVAPDEDVILIHRRADGAVLQCAGTTAQGFVVDAIGENVGNQMSASHDVPASAVATMFDRFAAGDPGWSSGPVWQGSPAADGGSAPSMRKPIIGILLLALGAVAGAVVASVWRRLVAVPWLCDQDGREVVRTTVGSGGVGLGDNGHRCYFADGTDQSVFDVAATFAWFEVFVFLAVLAIVWFGVTWLSAKLFLR